LSWIEEQHQLAGPGATESDELVNAVDPALRANIVGSHRLDLIADLLFRR
jgi:hypothetical protein